MNFRHYLTITVGTLVIGIATTQQARAGSECCPVSAQKSQTTPATTKTASTPAAPKVPANAVAEVLDQYAKIHAALAADSFGGVPAAAREIARLVNNDQAKSLPAHVAKQAEDLANAKDLAAARNAFKPLSQSLARYLAAEKIQTGKYHQVYCPMVKAGCIQTTKAVQNPYHGSEMLKCGEVVGTY